MTKSKLEKREKNDVNVFVRMPPTLREQLAKMASKLNVSEAQVVRVALRHFAREVELKS